MFYIEFTLQVISPLMIGKTISEQEFILNEYNHRQNRSFQNKYIKKIYKAELNSNSFKGLLRWWYRKLNLNFSDEEIIFGSTEKSSPVKIIVHEIDKERRTFEARLRSNNNFGKYTFSSGTGFYNGLSYFGHFIYSKQKPRRQNNFIGTIQSHEYLPVNNRFIIKFISHDEEILKKIMLIFWLLAQFGGIGYRSRRCFGNFIIEDIHLNFDINGQFSFKNSFTSLDEYKQILSQNLSYILKYFENQNSDLNNTRIFYGSNYLASKWQEAINFAGATMQIYRALKENDHTNIHNFHSLNSIERAIFGLPIQYSGITVNHFIENQKENGKIEYSGQRLASPILVSLSKIEDKFISQYLIFPFDYNLLNLKVVRDKNIKPIRLKNITNDFIDYLINPESHSIPGNLNEDINLFRYSELTFLEN